MTLVTVAQHKHLIVLWLNYNGRRGTDKQISNFQKIPMALDTLMRMLKDRGLV